MNRSVAQVDRLPAERVDAVVVEDRPQLVAALHVEGPHRLVAPHPHRLGPVLHPHEVGVPAAVHDDGRVGAVLGDVRREPVDRLAPQREVLVGVALDRERREGAELVLLLVPVGLLDLPAVVRDELPVRQAYDAEVHVGEEVDDEVLRLQLGEQREELAAEVAVDVPDVVVVHRLQRVPGDLHRRGHLRDHRGLVGGEVAGEPALVVGVEPRVEVVAGGAAAGDRDDRRVRGHVSLSSAGTTARRTGVGIGCVLGAVAHRLADGLEHAFAALAVARREGRLDPGGVRLHRRRVRAPAPRWWRRPRPVPSSSPDRSRRVGSRSSRLARRARRRAPCPRRTGSRRPAARGRPR